MTANANRFLAPVINTKLLPSPDAIEPWDEEKLFSERMADFQLRADEAGFPYDVGALETDPIVIDQQVHAYREALMRARVNSAVRAVLPAFAQGSDLDAIAARANVVRQIVTPAQDDGTPAVYETDAQLLLRYLTSFAVPAAGSADGYIYAAVTAVPELRDVAVLGPGVHGEPGRVEIPLLWGGGAPVPGDKKDAVEAAVTADNVKPLTDLVQVQQAEVISYDVAMVAKIPAGPAPLEVKAEIEKAVRAAADARYALGVNVWRNVLEGAGYVANVEKIVLTQPEADILPGPYGAAYCGTITVTLEQG